MHLFSGFKKERKKQTPDYDTAYSETRFRYWRKSIRAQEAQFVHSHLLEVMQTSDTIREAHEKRT